VDEKAASALEFEFDNIRETVDKIRRTTPVNNDPYLRSQEEDEISPEERRRRIEEAQRRRQEALARPINVVKLSSPQTIIDLESQPAYLRRSVNLDDVPDSEQPAMSDWTVSLEEEGEIKVGGNAYLHDNVD
jgi:cell division protein FtsZ